MRALSRSGYLGALAAVALLSGAFEIGLLLVDGRALLYLSDLGIAAAAAVAVGAMAWRARRERGSMRRAWTWTSAACGSWLLGQLAWSWQQLSGADPLPFPSVADVGFLLAMPLAGAAVLSLDCSAAGRSRGLLDGGLAGATTLLAVWSVLLAAAPERLGDGSLADTLAVAYPVAITAVGAMVAVVATRTTGVAARHLAAVAAGWGCLGFTSVVYAWLLIHDSYRTGHASDVGWLTAFALLAAAAIRPPAAGGRPLERRRVLALPYLPLFVAAGALATGRVEPDVVLVGAGAVVVAIVVVRQYLTIVENQRLTRTLEDRVFQQTQELAHSEARYREALAAAGIGSFEYDLRSGRLFLSLEAQAIFGVEPGTFAGTIEAALERAHPDDALGVLAVLARLGTATEDVLEFRVGGPDGEVRWVEVRGRFRRTGGRNLLVGVITDVSERRRSAAELDRLAHTDGLTGLPNRLRLFECLEEAARSGRAHSLLLMDLDGFKEVNDGLGHDTGDRFLEEVAVRLRSSLRPGDLVARLGGDEFAVVAFDTGAGVAVAEHLLAALSLPIEVAGLRLPVTASVGIAVAGESCTTAGDLLRCADVAMYRAKQRGGAWALFDQDLDRRQADRVAMIADLRAAIDDDAIDLHFQPQVHLRTGDVVAVEALARWTHPTRGVVSPTEFIPLAEHSGLIRDLTPRLLRRALDQCRRWRSEGFDLQVSYNLSPRLLHDPGLAPSIDRALLEARVPPSALTLEITEGAFADETPAVARTLAELHALGIRLSVDDFGTGYSSLGYLKRLPVDDVKLDRTFIAGLPGHADTGIVRAVIELARHLGLSVVAEGVEREEALEDLRRWGCTLAQGYLIARPQPATELTAWLAARSSEVVARGDAPERAR